MSPIVWIGVAAGGALGAPARFLVDRALRARLGGRYPWGTFVVNVTGSFLLGAVAGLGLDRGLPPEAETIVGTGLFGGYTTYSTFSVETVRLAGDGSWGLAGLNVAGTLSSGLAAAAVGLWMTSL